MKQTSHNRKDEMFPRKRLAVKRDTIPTCEEEARIRPAMKGLAVKKRSALESRRLRTSPGKRLATIPTCEEET